MRKDVEFQSEGTTVKGMFLTPDDGSGPWPTVVMAGGWCYVKELVQPSYAEVINKSGIAALIIDYRRLGESGGEPRQHIDPWDQIEDYRNAISHAETMDEVDSDRIGIWGISYSGGHVLIVGATDPRVKCVVSNIPVVSGYDNMRRVHGSINFRRLQELVAADRAARFTGEPSGYIPMSSSAPNDEQTTWPFPEGGEVFEQLKQTEAPN
ncbi:MAG: alpha/beta hydrolase, partial [Solirubrobacterales bacterium]